MIKIKGRDKKEEVLRVIKNQESKEQEQEESRIKEGER